MNLLKHEKSPYLLQHKDNPVHWQTWSEEAFEGADQKDKPVFLSIGYSTCHWCHVMEKESFEDEEVASLLNEAFVCIKVDREERPDIDHIYMKVCQMFTQHGGWPLTILMSAEKKPFFAATYIPKESMYGQMGLMEFIPHVKDMWKNEREKILSSADMITQKLAEQDNFADESNLNISLIEKTTQELVQRFDTKNGGFSPVPKFPTCQNLLFILPLCKKNQKTKDQSRLPDMVSLTLDAIRRGGIHDHIGWGFHRYSTDENWLLPHFEKMLYDQGMLSMTYLEAYLTMKDKVYLDTTENILEYVLRDMWHKEGGFYSAEDADSEGEEGKFYTWEYSELKKVLSENDFSLMENVYGIKKEGNYLDEASQKLSGRNILHLTSSEENICRNNNMSRDELESRLAAIRKKLFSHRENRVHPYKDDKILTDWNGLMLVSLARAFRVTRKEKYRKAFQDTIHFICQRLVDKEGLLMHRYRDGESGIHANVDDYAFFIWGLIEVYEADFSIACLEKAIDFTDKMIEFFWDPQKGGFFFTSKTAEKILVRNKEWYDTALPSGNSIAAYVLSKLFFITGSMKYRDMVIKLMQASYSLMKYAPSAQIFMIMVANSLLFSDNSQIVILCKNKEDVLDPLNTLHEKYDPHRTVLVVEESQIKRLSVLISYIKDMKMIDQKITYYVCEKFSCKKPSTSLEEN